MSGQELFFRYAKRAFDERWLTNAGPNARELEKRLASLHGVKRCVLFCNCFTGFYLALRHAAGKGKLASLPERAAWPLADAARWAGLEPLFQQVPAGSLAPDLAEIEASLRPGCAIIIASRPLAGSFDPAPLEALAASRNLPLFVDSAFTFEPAARGGLARFYSMRQGQLLDAGEGGYMATDDEAFAEAIAQGRAFGFSGRDHIARLGLNAKLNELHAALALTSLDRLDERQAGVALARNIFGEILGAEAIVEPASGATLVLRENKPEAAAALLKGAGLASLPCGPGFLALPLAGLDAGKARAGALALAEAGRP